MRSLVAGVDIGGSGTKACLLDQGHIIATAALPTDMTDSGGLAGLVVRVLDVVLAESGRELIELSAIGIGVPGQVNEGAVRNAANLGIDETGFDLGGIVSSATQVATIVENDMRVAAYGAFTQSTASDPSIRSLVYVGLGTGVSAGVVLDGEIFRGSRGLAGEFGHVPMGSDITCVCGSVGCLETVVGAAGLRQSWDGENAGSVFTSAATGNTRAKTVADKAIGYLADGMWWLAATYDPDLFFIGGGVGANTPSIRSLLAARWVEMGASSAFARRVLDPDRIRLYDLEEPVGAYGAALLAAAGRDRSGKRHATATREEESIP